MRLPLLALSDVNRCAAQADDGTHDVSQRLNVQIMPTFAGSSLDADLAILRAPGFQRRTLQGDNRRAAGRREYILVGMADDLIDLALEYGIADGGVTQVAILRINSHIRTA